MRKDSYKPFEYNRLLSGKEVAKRLKICKRTVLRLFQCNRLPGFMIGRKWYVREADLQRVMLRLVKTANSRVKDV